MGNTPVLSSSTASGDDIFFTSAHEHGLALKRCKAVALLSRSPWTCDNCRRMSVFHPTMRRHSCTEGCDFDLCGICMAAVQSNGSSGHRVDGDASAASGGVRPALLRAASGLSVASTRLKNAKDESEIFGIISVGETQVDVLRKAEQTSQTAAECAICYDDLCNGQLSVLFQKGQRACRHFFHSRCLTLLAENCISSCPLCRVHFSEVRAVPSPMENPSGWFRAMDAHGQGKLTRREVDDALRALLPIDANSFESYFETLWSHWDKTNSGDIGMDEFVDQDGGLLQWVISMTKTVRARGLAKPPDLAVDREAWFRFWDSDESGSLDKEQVMRALMKTFRDADVAQMRSVVGAMWDDFCGGGDSINFEEFMLPRKGLLDTILNNIGVVAADDVPPPPASQPHSSTLGAQCSCGKLHVHRGDRVRRAPSQVSARADGESEFGTVVEDDERSGMVSVHWDVGGSSPLLHYAWPTDPLGHEVVHADFSSISPDVLALKDSLRLSSAAAIELLRRQAASEAVDHVDEESLRRPVELFHRCRILPDKELVKHWFDNVPPCPCTNPACEGALRWNERAEKHLGREAYVLKIDLRDDTVRVEVTGRCNCKLWVPRLAVASVYDPDTEQEPRFSVGTRVECNMGEQWATGTVERIWWRQEGWGNRSTAPYMVKLDAGNSISAPADHDRTIRRIS